MGRSAKEVREVVLLLFDLFHIQVQVSAVSILVLDMGRMVSVRKNRCYIVVGKKFVVFPLFVTVKGIELVMVKVIIIMAAQLEVRRHRILLILRRLGRVFLC